MAHNRAATAAAVASAMQRVRVETCDKCKSITTTTSSNGGGSGSSNGGGLDSDGCIDGNERVYVRTQFVLALFACFVLAVTMLVKTGPCVHWGGDCQIDAFAWEKDAMRNMSTDAEAAAAAAAAEATDACTIVPPVDPEALRIPPEGNDWRRHEDAMRLYAGIEMRFELNRVRRVHPGAYRCRVDGNPARAPAPGTIEPNRWEACVFRAQDGEDIAYMDRIRPLQSSGRDMPVFPVGASHLIVEAGAWDGVGFSTSWFFARHLGWRALHFEPSPRNFPRLVRNRPEAANVQRALCSAPREQNVTWIDQRLGADGGGGAVGGVEALMAPSFRAHFHPQAEFDAGRSERTAAVCGQLRCYLRALGVRQVDLFVLDVEGAELEALRAFDWGAVRVDTWIVEADGRAPAKDAAVRALMLEHGYTYERLGRNDWFYLNDSLLGLR